jgi:hypothetical protein
MGHYYPSLRANGSHERAPDDKFREAIETRSFRGDAKASNYDVQLHI